MKKINTSQKYYIVLFLVVIIAIGFIVYLNKQFIINVPIGESIIPAVNKTEAKVVFDVYEMKTEDNDYKWQDAVVIPRIIGSDNVASENLFFEYAIQKIAGDLSRYILVEKDKQPGEANEIIDSMASNNNIDADGLSGDSQIYIRDYMLKNDIFSGLFYFYSTGGAHPIDSPVVVNYDLLNKREIALNDILSISGDGLIDYLDIEQNRLYPVVPGEPENLNCSREELAPGGFYMTESNLIIMTSPHRLNSYCSSSFEFKYSTIKEVINKNGPLMRIITQ